MKKKILMLISLCFLMGSTSAQEQGDKTTFLLGGLLYAGELPINNPVNTGDIGFAYLYSVGTNNITPVDTILFDSLGYYYFEQVPAGNYFIKAGLMAGSRHFNDYLPAYFGEAAVWERADTFYLNANTYSCHINMPGIQPSLAGSGKISGFLTFENFQDSPLPPCEVILSSPAGVPAAYTYSGPSGTFSINNIPYGDYVLTADVTGKTAQKIPLSLNEGKPQAEGIEIRLHNGPQGIQLLPAATYAIDIFPNPTPDKLNIRVRSLAQTDLLLTLTDLQGVPLFMDNLSCTKGETFETVDLSGLSPGAYLLKLQDVDTKEVTIRKILRR